MPSRNIRANFDMTLPTFTAVRAEVLKKVGAHDENRLTRTALRKNASALLGDKTGRQLILARHPIAHYLPATVVYGRHEREAVPAPARRDDAVGKKGRRAAAARLQNYLRPLA